MVQALTEQHDESETTGTAGGQPSSSGSGRRLPLAVAAALVAAVAGWFVLVDDRSAVEPTGISASMLPEEIELQPAESEWWDSALGSAPHPVHTMEATWGGDIATMFVIGRYDDFDHSSTIGRQLENEGWSVSPSTLAVGVRYTRDHLVLHVLDEWILLSIAGPPVASSVQSVLLHLGSPLELTAVTPESVTSSSELPATPETVAPGGDLAAALGTGYTTADLAPSDWPLLNSLEGEIPLPALMITRDNGGSGGLALTAAMKTEQDAAAVASALAAELPMTAPLGQWVAYETGPGYQVVVVGRFVIQFDAPSGFAQVQATIDDLIEAGLVAP